MFVSSFWGGQESGSGSVCLCVYAEGQPEDIQTKKSVTNMSKRQMKNGQPEDRRSLSTT